MDHVHEFLSVFLLSCPAWVTDTSSTLQHLAAISYGYAAPRHSVWPSHQLSFPSSHWNRYDQVPLPFKIPTNSSLVTDFLGLSMDRFRSSYGQFCGLLQADLSLKNTAVLRHFLRMVLPPKHRGNIRRNYSLIQMCHLPQN